MVVMTPPPAVVFMNFGADALEFEIRAILRDINFGISARSEINFAIRRQPFHKDPKPTITRTPQLRQMLTGETDDDHDATLP